MWYILRYIPWRWGIARTAKLFKNGRSQAVRLPREFRFSGSEVFIEKRGEEVVLRPKKADLDAFFTGPNPIPADFLVKRKPWKFRKRRFV